MFSRGSIFSRPAPQRKDFVPIGLRAAPLPQKVPADLTLESSFDEATDPLDTLHLRAEAPARTEREKWSGAHILAGESTSVQALQQENKELSGENYSLKVNLASLMKILKSVPADTSALAEQHMQLTLRLEETERELANAKRGSELARAADAEKRSLARALETREAEVALLKRELAAKKAAPDLGQRVEYLQTENQRLMRQLELAAASNTSASAVQAENNELKTRVFRLERQVAETPPELRDQLENAASETLTLQRKLDAAKRDLEQAEQERDAAQQAGQLRARELQMQIDALRNSNDSFKATQARGASETDARLHAALQDASDLRARLHAAESAAELKAERNATTIQRLEAKIASLNRDLKDKDREEYNLRAQVRSLMEERLSAADDKTTLKHYQSQIDTLREKERALVEENKLLQDEAAELQNELYSHNVKSARTDRLELQISELTEKLDFYENEYAALQEKLEQAESRIRTLNEARDMGKSTQLQVLQLESEIDNLTTQLRKAKLSQPHRYNESEILEVEESARKREESEKRRLRLQIDALNVQVQQLEEALHTQKPAFDDERLQGQIKRLKADLDEKEYELQRKSGSLRDKDETILELEARIRDLRRELKFSVEQKPAGPNYESELRALQMENKQLQHDLESQVKFYQTKLDIVMERERREGVQRPPQSASTSATVALLESELADLRQQNNELLSKLSALKDELLYIKEPTNISDEHRSRLKELRGKLEKAQEEKSRAEFSLDDAEAESKLLRSENTRLDAKVKLLTLDLARTQRHCSKLANKINEMDIAERRIVNKKSDEDARTKLMNAQMQSEIELLNSKLAKIGSVETAARRMRLLENELTFYKSKLYEFNMRCNDLAFLNTFMLSSIKNSNQSIKNDLVQLAKCGIYPDYSQLKSAGRQKLTFKTVAVFVLGAVRLRRRLEKARERTEKLDQLRGEIERDKIMMAARG